MSKSAILGLRLTPELKAALERAAGEDERSVSYLVIRILTDWVKLQGYIR